jgi:hypothetical protein
MTYKYPDAVLMIFYKAPFAELHFAIFIAIKQWHGHLPLNGINV